MVRRKRIVLEGPAAEAVERLAKAAGVSPAELIKRALRREDEALRREAEGPVPIPPRELSGFIRDAKLAAEVEQLVEDALRREARPDGLV